MRRTCQGEDEIFLSKMNTNQLHVDTRIGKMTLKVIQDRKLKNAYQFDACLRYLETEDGLAKLGTKWILHICN